MSVYSYLTDIGNITITEKHGSITGVYFAHDKQPKDVDHQETPLLKEAYRQLTSYLDGRLKEFFLPLAPDGTVFMQQVWTALCAIPYGETASYKEIAVKVGNPKAYRAVGLANNRNPIPLFIPCHRVIGANGSLTGYRGGLEMKNRLLRLESGQHGDF